MYRSVGADLYIYEFSVIFKIYHKTIVLTSQAMLGRLLEKEHVMTAKKSKHEMT